MPNNNQLIFVSNPYRGGYVIDCFRSHNSFPKDVMTANFIDAPTLWEAQKWLREEKRILILPDYNSFGWFCGIHYPINSVKMFKYTAKEVNSYEDALSEGIKEAVKILEDGLDSN